MSDVKSFDALLEGIPDIDGILKTLECYEEKGVIDYYKFTQIIDMDLLYLKELNTAFTHMQRGLERQIEKEGSLEDGLVYLQAMNYIARKMIEKTDAIDPMPESTKDNPNFIILNSELFMAYRNNDIQHLKDAIFYFKEYLGDVKPELLEDLNNKYEFNTMKADVESDTIITFFIKYSE